jgi:hypothetical protein
MLYQSRLLSILLLFSKACVCRGYSLYSIVVILFVAHIYMSLLRPVGFPNYSRLSGLYPPIKAMVQLIIWSQNLHALRSYLSCGNRGQGKPCEGSSLVPIRPILLRTHPGNIKSLKACSQRCWTFVPKPIPIHTAQEGAFLKVEKLYHSALLYSVCLILFFCRLKTNHNIGLEVLYSTCVYSWTWCGQNIFKHQRVVSSIQSRTGMLAQ